MIIETCPLLEELPWIRHGFFGLDNPQALTKNLAGIQKFSDEFPRVLFLKQNHGDTVMEDVFDTTADASITSETGLALAIKTADCCPILLACTKTKQITAVHAGWRGALNRITLKTIHRLIENGAQPQTLIASIGPNIHWQSYPVGDDVRASFAESQPETLSFFHTVEDRWKLDVAGIVRQQIMGTGITNIWQSTINTFTDPGWSSYRQYKADPALPEARNVSLIMKINP